MKTFKILREFMLINKYRISINKAITFINPQGQEQLKRVGQELKSIGKK